MPEPRAHEAALLITEHDHVRGEQLPFQSRLATGLPRTAQEMKSPSQINVRYSRRTNSSHKEGCHEVHS